MVMRYAILSITLLAILGCHMTSVAQPTEISSVTTDSVKADTVVVKRSFLGKVIDYFSNANRTNNTKNFDISIIGGPHYSSDTRLGIGLVAAGYYKENPADTLENPSNVSLYGDVATTGYYLIGLRGDHLIKNDARRFSYDLYFYSFPRYFWGLGYDMGNNMDNKSKFKELYVNFSASFLWRLGKHIYVGPTAQFAFANARQRVRPELWNGQDSHVTSYGIGATIQYDSRDNRTAPTTGYFIGINQRCLPRFMGNDYAFSYTELFANSYHNLWRGATLATSAHGRLAYGNVPWDLMSTFGGSRTMRGYYEGRFRDKGELDLTFELRQHIWRRNGLVVWLGAGTVFPKISEIHFRNILPNGGIGYRWEFKKLTNVRLDYGFARGEGAFIFSINEAF